MNQTRAIQSIDQHGALLVFPIKNAKEPASLWSAFYPRSEMRWEWDENGDDRVGRLWHLMKKLSKNTEVVYSKWYSDRATFFSRELFTAMLAVFYREGIYQQGLSRNAETLLEILENDSPLSTKELKKAADLQGRDNEAAYSRAMKELFRSLRIVGFGEVEDGAFPSLAVGATRLLYEDLWLESQRLSEAKARALIDKQLPPGSKMRAYFDKTLKAFRS